MNKHLHNALVTLGVLLGMAVFLFFSVYYTEVVLGILIFIGLTALAVCFAIMFGWWKK